MAQERLPGRSHTLMSQCVPSCPQGVSSSARLPTQPLLRAWLGARVPPALLLGPGAARRGRSPGNLRAPPAPGQSQGWGAGEMEASPLPFRLLSLQGPWPQTDTGFVCRTLLKEDARRGPCRTARAVLRRICRFCACLGKDGHVATWAGVKSVAPPLTTHFRFALVPQPLYSLSLF